MFWTLKIKLEPEAVELVWVMETFNWLSFVIEHDMLEIDGDTDEQSGEQGSATEEGGERRSIDDCGISVEGTMSNVQDVVAPFIRLERERLTDFSLFIVLIFKDIPVDNESIEQPEES